MSIANFSVESRWNRGGGEPGVSASMKAFLSYVNDEERRKRRRRRWCREKETERCGVREKGAGRQAGKWEEREEDNRTGRSKGEQRVLIDTAVLIPSNSFYFIRFCSPS